MAESKKQALDDLSAEDVIELLDLAPHPEGGFYRETSRDQRSQENRALSTAIYFLLRDGDISRWHRIDSAEVWHWYRGATLLLSICRTDKEKPKDYRLGNRLTAGESPQIVVPRKAWQQAQAVGGWVLVGCSVAPGFDFAQFELAPEGWAPGTSR